MDDPLINFAISIIGPAVLCGGGLLLAIGVVTLVGWGVKRCRPFLARLLHWWGK